MLTAETITINAWKLLAQAELPPSVLFGETGMDLWPYRSRTISLLRRYARASVEVGRLPSLLGREFFRSRVRSYSASSFEELVVFVTDMEHTLEELDELNKKLLAMYALEEYTVPEISRSLVCSEKTVHRLINDAIDELSRHLLHRGLLETMPQIVNSHMTTS